MLKILLTFFIAIPLLSPCFAGDSSAAPLLKTPSQMAHFKGDWKTFPDIRLLSDSPVDPSALSGKSLVETTLLRNSIFARHGFRFTTPWIAKYFESRSWYKPGNFSQSQLTATERQNVEILLKAEAQLKNAPSFETITALPDRSIEGLPDLRVSPGAVLTEDQLQDRSEVELRVLRNSIYAAHGRSFKSHWLQTYFESRSWYKPSAQYSDDSLTPEDKQNVELIQRYEMTGLGKNLREQVLAMHYCYIESEDDNAIKLTFTGQNVLVTERHGYYEQETAVKKRLWRIQDGGLEVKLDKGPWQRLQFISDRNTCLLNIPAPEASAP